MELYSNQQNRIPVAADIDTLAVIDTRRKK